LEIAVQPFLFDHSIGSGAAFSIMSAQLSRAIAQSAFLRRAVFGAP